MYTGKTHKLGPFTFYNLHGLYIFMKKYKREFNSGFYQIESINYEKDESGNEKFIMKLFMVEDNLPECMKLPEYQKNPQEEIKKIFANINAP